MAMLETVYDFPALRVLKRPAQSFGPDKGFIRFRHGEKAGIPYQWRGETLIREYRVGTVLGYAIENYEDPDAAREMNRKNGGDDHWLNPSAVSISSRDRPQEVLYLLNDGDLIAIEGHHYRVELKRNEHINLIPVNLIPAEAGVEEVA